MSENNDHFRLLDAIHDDITAAVNRLAEEDIFGQMLDRSGPVAKLGTEGDDVKLDWVDGIEKALANPQWLADVENEAAGILRQDIRHIIWAGMGGSVQTIYSLKRLGLLEGESISIHPLDSTDPATLSRILGEIAELDDIDLGNEGAIREVISTTMMIGVSMGMTSEEPITHLEWFDGLLNEYDIPAASNHIQVMTLPDSYLDQFAKPRGSRMVSLQLDGENHTGGRFSAPATRVFLRPLALMLVSRAWKEDESKSFDGQLLRPVLEQILSCHPISHEYGEEVRKEQARSDPFIQLAAAIEHHGRSGRNKVVLRVSDEWKGIEPWVEQVVEESLGKGGRGFTIFYADSASLEAYQGDVIFVTFEPADVPGPEDKLKAAGHPVFRMQAPSKSFAAAAGFFLGWERLVAAYGRLSDIVYAGQPAVEGYKKYARDLRLADGPVPFPEDTPHQAKFGCWTLYYNSLVTLGLLLEEKIPPGADAAEAYATILRHGFELFTAEGRVPYLDFTFNGELSPEVHETLKRARRKLSDETLRVRTKIRSGPADYHSTEQSETDGPPEVISLRLVGIEHDAPIAGEYSDKFLLAQARGTWQAMEDAGRWIMLMAAPRVDVEALQDLEAFFEKVRNA